MMPDQITEINEIATILSTILLVVATLILARASYVVARVQALPIVIVYYRRATFNEVNTHSHPPIILVIENIGHGFAEIEKIVFKPNPIIDTFQENQHINDTFLPKTLAPKQREYVRIDISRYYTPSIPKNNTRELRLAKHFMNTPLTCEISYKPYGLANILKSRIKAKFLLNPIPFTRPYYYNLE